MKWHYDKIARASKAFGTLKKFQLGWLLIKTDKEDGLSSSAVVLGVLL